MNIELIQAQQEFNDAVEKLFKLLDEMTEKHKENVSNLGEVTKKLTELTYGLQTN